MNLKKFISGVSALTIAASAFAGLAVVANAADIVETTTYDFSTAEGAPTFDKKRNTNTVVSADDTTTTTISGDKGLLQIIPSGNPGNGYAGSRLDLSEILDGATSFKISYKTFWNIGSRGVIGIGAAADRDRDAIGKTNATTDGLIGTLGRFSSEAFLRATSGGNRAFLSSFTDATNRWISTVINVDVTNMKYTYTLEGDTKVTIANNASITSIPDMLEIVAWTPADTSTIELDDLSIEVTKPEPGAATDIVVNYTANGSTVDSRTIDISAANKKEGDTSDTFYVPAYVTDTNGNVYATNLTDFHKEVELAAGTTTVDVPVTAVAGLKNYFFEAEGHGGGAAEATNAYAYSMGGGMRRLDTKAVTVTVPEDGIYDVKAALICKSSKTTNATITATAGDKTWDITDTYYNAYRAAAHTESDVALTAGTVISFATSDWNMGLDYVLLTKTAELPAPELGATIDDQGVENGTKEFAKDSATWFIITVANTGDATGSYDTVSITDGTEIFNAEVANATLDAGASIVYGGVVEGVYDFNAASVLSAE